MIVRSILAFALAVGTAHAQTKWDMPTPYSDGEFHTRNVAAFVEDVKKATGGKLEIVVRPAGELPFRATEVVKVAGDGQVQLVEAYQGFISGALPLASIASLPFLVRNGQDLEKVWPIIDKFTAPLFAKAGVQKETYVAPQPDGLYERIRDRCYAELKAGKQIIGKPQQTPAPARGSMHDITGTPADAVPAHRHQRH